MEELEMTAVLGQLLVLVQILVPREMDFLVPIQIYSSPSPEHTFLPSLSREHSPLRSVADTVDWPSGSIGLSHYHIRNGTGLVNIR